MNHGKIIDAHAHLGGIPDKEGKIWGSFRDYKRIVTNLEIDKYCVVPIGLPENFENKSTPDNNSVLEKISEDDSIIPFYWFNVFDLPDKISEKYKAIKYHPDIGDVSPDDERVVSFVKKIGLPVFIHTNERKDYCNLGKISNLAEKVEVPVVAVHSGSATRTFFNFDKYDFSDNVYFETSGIQYSLILKKIYNKFGSERIIFGSDYPFGDPRVSLARVDSLDLSEYEKELILSGNIKSILRSEKK